MTLIQADRLTKLYGTVLGINDICLSLPPGGYGLIGPNGSGKTTLLHILMGLLSPTLGSIQVLGATPNRGLSWLRRLGYCPAVDGLYSTMSGLDWVSFLLEMYAIPPREARQRARETLQRLGMQSAMSRPMGTYSRGMRQRVKFAQALAHDPELLVLDEPFNGLDPVARHEMTKLLRDWLERGRSLILASHVLHEVESVTPNFMLICGGRLLASGSSHEVHELLAGLPVSLRIRCARRETLASLLTQAQLVESLRFDSADGILHLETRQPLEIYQHLPRWDQSHGLRLRGLESTDDSLQSLFEKLFQIQRGEL